MRRFKNILLVTNGEGRGAALSRAVALAKTNGAALTVLGFVKEVPREVKLLLAALHPTDLQQELFHEASRRIERSVVRFQNQGIAITVKILPEKSPVETIREVLRNGHDLVMTTANGEERSWFGAAAIRLLRKCPVPVWVLSPGLRRRYRRVLAAVDPSQLESEAVGLNTKIMELATSLAHMEKSELHIVHAWTLYGEDVLRSRRISMPEEKIQQLLREERDGHGKKLEDLLSKHNLLNVKHEIHLIKGEADEVIPELAKKKRIDVVVMGTVARAGIAGFFIGNTAEKILGHVNCSVLAVKPDGFVSPVRLESE